MNKNEENNFRKRFGEVVRRYRTNKKLSQEELADLSNLHRTYISELERGLKTVSMLSLFQISKALKIPASLLIKEVEDIC